LLSRINNNKKNRTLKKREKEKDIEKNLTGTTAVSVQGQKKVRETIKSVWAKRA